MPQAKVSKESVQQLRQVVLTFASGIRGVGAQASQQEAEFAQASQQALGETQSVIDELTDRVASLRAQAEEARQARDEAQASMDALDEQISEAERQIRDLEAQMADLRHELARLEAELAQADEQSAPAIQQAINLVNAQIDDCAAAIASLNDSIDSYQSDKRRLASVRDEQENVRVKCEDEAYTEEQRKRRYDDKLARLGEQSRQVQTALDDFSDAAQRYESTSSATADQTGSALAECLAVIEEWESLQL